jgi:NAD(P)-dependent dehydrogenase (short-subunit alcohol dehydrogenase family)
MSNIKTIDPAWQAAGRLLENRVILVTGAADGIGRALATACASRGATVILLDRNVKGLETLYDEITAAGGPEPAIYPLDLKGATPADFQSLAEVLEKEFGRLDGLVHNAAYLGTLIPLAHCDDELWLEVMQINLNAPFLLTRSCLGLLQMSDAASVLFLSDSVGRYGKAYWGAYGIAKAGIENMAQTLADELESNTNVRVNTYDPGPVRTALRLIAYPAENREALASPEDVIKPCLYLLGPDSKGITGQQFVITDTQ